MKKDLNALLAAASVIAGPFLPEKKPVDPNAPCCVRCHEPMSLDFSGDMWLCDNFVCGMEEFFK